MLDFLIVILSNDIHYLKKNKNLLYELDIQFDLAIIKTVCPDGYAAFTQSLLVATKAVLMG
jgi:hypothetical protein